MQSLAAMRSKVEDLLRENEALRQSSNQEIAALRSKVEKLQTENEALRSEIIAWETENDALRSQLNASETENEALRSLINVPETETDGLRSQVNTSSQIDEQRQIFEPIGSLEELEELNKNAASKEFNRKVCNFIEASRNRHFKMGQIFRPEFLATCSWSGEGKAKRVGLWRYENAIALITEIIQMYDSSITSEDVKNKIKQGILNARKR